MPDGIASPPSEWTALLTLFGHLNPWLVGGAARALYFNLHHASKPRDWDIIVPVERAAAITQTMSRLSKDIGHTVSASRPYEFLTINPLPSRAVILSPEGPGGPESTPGAASPEAGPPPVKTCMAPGWKCVLKHHFAPLPEGSSDPQPIHLDIWCDYIIPYLASVPTAYDGIAVRMSDKFILLSHEFSMGRNFLISNRPVLGVAVDKIMKAHLMRQAL